ncbi:hypothetical protein FA13DRAFT_1752401 [Coprinellus micaceus]|uniref:DNA breaking-rejoining enzyme n=1 Tax=Coprinellus micaceus TaxID=71717 RepID=A0A4Y7TRB0_COPMI|nr:hypothetical protein FA13DRAFT_1752401 [Coprinellus micaceus]
MGNARLVLTVSPFRPHVLARDRLRIWIPLDARNCLDTDGTPINLSAEDMEQIMEVLVEAWAESTREVYSSLAYSPTIAWYILHGLPWDMCAEEIESLLKAANRMAPAKKKKRQPFTTAYISALQCGPELESNNLHIAVFACLTTTFYMAGHLGEFTVRALTGANVFNPAIHVKPTDMRIETNEQGLESTVFRLPRTKVVQDGEEVSWSKQDGVTDPKAALAKHMSTNWPPPNSPLFAYRQNNRKMKTLTKTKFIEVIHTAVDMAGPDHLQGHRICIGSTLEYLLRGVPFDVMKVKGRWASDTFQAYLRKHAQILAPYMQARSHKHEAFVHIVMPTVHDQ